MFLTLSVLTFQLPLFLHQILIPWLLEAKLASINLINSLSVSLISVLPLIGLRSSFFDFLMLPLLLFGIKPCLMKLLLLKQNHTCDLIPPNPSQHLVGKKWVFKLKWAADDSIQRYKARLVARGFPQAPDIDFHET